MSKLSIFLIPFLLLTLASCNKKRGSSATNGLNSVTQGITCVPNSVIASLNCKESIPFSSNAIKLKKCNSSGSGFDIDACVLQGCLANYHISENSCVPNTCNPNQSYGTVSCTDEIPHSDSATKSKTCNSSGNNYVYGSCTVTGCLTGYNLQGNSCVANACEPNQSYGTVSCTDEIPYSDSATKTKTCNSSGTDYDYGACTVTGCLTGYNLQGNSCVANACEPNQSYGTVSCTDEIPYSDSATKTKTCNASGSDYIYGSCSVTGCAAGYNLQGNSCIANVCEPNQNYGIISCTDEIPYSSIANKTKVCNSTGSDYLYGPCTVTGCSAGYNLQSDSCVANTCEPNQSYGVVSCTDEISYSSVAEKSKTCNASGSEYLYGSCSAIACSTGYNLQGNSCIANVCEPNQNYGTVSCTNEIPYSDIATKNKTCNSSGTDYIYDSCIVTDCQDYYVLNNNACIGNVSISNVTLTEGQSGSKNFDFVVTLSAPLGVKATIDYNTLVGTANGTDFKEESGSISIPPGVLTKKIQIKVFGDNTIEPNETFSVILSNPSSGVTITSPEGTGTIVNDD